MSMLWFNFIHGLNFNFFCFKLIIIITLPKNKRKENLNQGGNWITTSTPKEILNLYNLPLKNPIGPQPGGMGNNNY